MGSLTAAEGSRRLALFLIVIGKGKRLAAKEGNVK
jgi:hypothetical protein